ncbi:MAG: monooxygenase [Chloroflexi bacterium]|nr:monooxygenase [Chloroflexota bacterium]
MQPSTLSTPTLHQDTGRHHALVIGASIGGLLAARALADHYQQVTVLERDIFPAAGEHRKGVPQARHAHALLPSGREALEAFFPGLSEELVAQRAVLGDSMQNVVRFISGSYHRRFRSGTQTLYVSRPRLEAQIRLRLLALPNVQAIENCNVLGVTATPDNSQVTGVRLVRRSVGDTEEVMQADLVVDASGRGSHGQDWLQALGYAIPEAEQVKIDIGYASRVYERTAGEAQDAYSLLITTGPPNRRLGVMLAMEDNRWQVTLAGYLGDHPPTDPAGFLAFAKTLPTLDIYNVIRDAKPLSEPLPAKYPASTRHYYERLTRFPTGYLPFGDAICSFNPIYGQGMSVAALEAMVLRQCLAQEDQALASRFFAAVGHLLDIPWTIAVGNDLRFPEVVGKRSPVKPLIDWYLVKLHRAAQHDPAVVQAFGKVASLRASPKTLLHPRVAWRVLLGNLRSPARPRP